MTAIWEELQKIASNEASSLPISEGQLQIIRSAAMQIEDANETLADNDRVIKTQAERIVELEFFLSKVRDRIWECFMNTAGVLPFNPEPDTTAKKQTKRIIKTTP